MDTERGSKRAARQRDELMGKAVDAMFAIVERGDRGSFRSREDALAQVLVDAGREVTRQLLSSQVEPQPEEVVVDGEQYRMVLEEGSCRVCTPFGVVSVPRARYRRMGQRGTKGTTTIGLVEKRAGIIEGATPRMAEIISYYDACVPSRESERLLDLAGLRGPRRAAIEKKAGSIGSKMATDADALLVRARRVRPLPEGAAMITIGVDRVNVAYEEPNPDGKKSERTQRLREKKPYVRKEPEPITRQFRGDFVGNTAIRDEHGELIGGYAYGLSHDEDPRKLARWIAADVAEAVRRCPGIRVSVCQDGARELWPLIWESLQAEPDLADITIWACVDFHQ